MEVNLGPIASALKFGPVNCLFTSQFTPGDPEWPQCATGLLKRVRWVDLNSCGSLTGLPLRMLHHILSILIKICWPLGSKTFKLESSWKIEEKRLRTQISF